MFISIIAIALVVTVAIVIICKNGESPGSYRNGLPDVIINGNEDADYIGTSSSGVVIKATNGLELKSGTLSQTVDFENPNQNQCAITVSIYLSNGTCIYESGYIYPGETVSKIELSTELKSGIYANALMYYRCYSTDKSHTAISQCEIPIEIRCI